MEKGVGLWMRDAAGDEWVRAVVVKITASTGGNGAAKQCEVVVRLSDGPSARTDQTLTIDVAALENEEMHDMLLANSHDMVRTLLAGNNRWLVSLLCRCANVIVGGICMYI